MLDNIDISFSKVITALVISVILLLCIINLPELLSYTCKNTFSEISSIKVELANVIVLLVELTVGFVLELNIDNITEYISTKTGVIVVPLYSNIKSLFIVG